MARAAGSDGVQVRVAPPASRTTPVSDVAPSLVTVQVTVTTSPADGLEAMVPVALVTDTEGTGAAVTSTVTVTSTHRPETGSVMR